MSQQKISIKPDPIIKIKFNDDLETLSKEINGEWGKTQPALPKTLYHYTDVYGLKGIITTQQLWFTHVKYFKDFSEGKYSDELANKIIGDILSKTSNENVKEFLNQLIEHHNEPLYKDIFISCLSEKADVLSQWESYSRNGSGYALGFNLSENLHLGYNNLQFARKASLYKLIYDKKDQTELLQNSIHRICTYIEKDKNANILECHNFYLNTVDSLLHLFKNESFKQEEEWRLSISLHGLSYKSNIESEYYSHIEFRDSNGILIPYIPLQLIEPDDGHNSSFPLKEIWTGWKLKNYDSSAITMLLRKHGLNDVVIQESGITLR